MVTEVMTVPLEFSMSRMVPPEVPTDPPAESPAEAPVKVTVPKLANGTSEEPSE